MFGRRKNKKPDSKPGKTAYDPSIYKPVLHCSICNGEQVAGFKNRQTGKFEEIGYIRNEAELAEFLKQYGLDSIEKEY